MGNVLLTNELNFLRPLLKQVTNWMHHKPAPRTEYYTYFGPFLPRKLSKRMSKWPYTVWDKETKGTILQSVVYAISGSVVAKVPEN